MGDLGQVAKLLQPLTKNVRQQSKSAHLELAFSAAQRDRNSISGRITGTILYEAIKAIAQAKNCNKVNPMTVELAL